MPVGVEPLPPLEVELVEVEGVDVDGLLTVELDGLLTVVLDGLLEVEEPLDWLGDTVYTAEGFGRLLELELEGLLIDEAAGLLLVDDGRTADGELIPLDGLP